MTLRSRSFLGMTLLAFGLVSLTVNVPTASAVVFVTTCSDTCNANCELANDLNCSGQSGITLNSGADLDMHGHSLSCTSSCPATAVTMTGNGSVVKNNLGASFIESAITGAFTTAVNCGGRTTSEVTGIRIDLSASTPTQVTGVLNCARVDNNVIVNGGNSSQSLGVATDGVANSDFVSNNRFEGWGITFWLTSTSAKQIQIDGNQIILEETGGNEVMLWIPVSKNSAPTFENNAIFDHATAASYFVNIGGGTITTHAVYCDPAVTACTSCIECAADFAPFPLP